MVQGKGISMKVKVCPICDREMGPGKICPNCKSYVRKPNYYDKQSFIGTPSAKPGECGCDIHMPELPRIEKQDITGRSVENDYREAYGDDYESRALRGVTNGAAPKRSYGAQSKSDSDLSSFGSKEGRSGKNNPVPAIVRVVIAILIMQFAIPLISLLIRLLTDLFD